MNEDMEAGTTEYRCEETRVKTEVVPWGMKRKSQQEWYYEEKNLKGLELIWNLRPYMIDSPLMLSLSTVKTLNFRNIPNLVPLLCHLRAWTTKVF